MGEAADRLLAYQHAEDCYTVSPAEVRDLQIAAMNERLQERIEKIRILGMRAGQAGIREIGDFADVVALLLPHTAYKSYPEGFLLQQRWDKLTKWLGTVSAYPVDNVDLDGIMDVDAWITRLEQAGHYVSSSSGTTGKSAMLVASKQDMDWVGEDSVVACAWSTGFRPARDRRIFRLAAVAAVPRNVAIMERIQRAFGKQDVEMFRYPIPPITVGSITRMVALRRAITDGSALPGDIAEYESTSAAREKAFDDAIGLAAEALIAARGEKLFLTGMWANLHKIATAVRERGFSGLDFHPDNMMYVGGGLKGQQLPSNYREFISETFNVGPGRNFQIYGMQEIGSVMPRCHLGGRYHVPPWLICLPLDQDGEALVGSQSGEVQGRAGFFDVSLDGRWGGVISGDRIEVNFGPCPCGAQTPSIADNIVRYTEIQGDDKISCAGTVDAYVRGMI
jgi:hypothetical protein